jgi:hypothetical protein
LFAKPTPLNIKLGSDRFASSTNGGTSPELVHRVVTVNFGSQGIEEQTPNGIAPHVMQSETLMKHRVWRVPTSGRTTFSGPALG